MNRRRPSATMQAAPKAPRPASTESAVRTDSERGSSQRFSDRRDAIVSAASAILIQRGIKGMTLADVAQSVGLITTSVTYYFKRKDDLVAACLLRTIERIETLIESAARETTLADRGRTLIRSYFELQRRIELGEEPPLVPFIDARGLRKPHAESIGAAYSGIFKSVRSVFEPETHAASNRRARDARATLLLFLVTWVPAWVHKYDSDEYSRLADRMLDILMNGLATQPAEQWTPPPAIAVAQAEAPDAYETFLIAATGLLNERGYYGASVDKIVSRVSVTKGAFYHHLDSKDELIAQCYERTFEIIRNAQNAASTLNGSWWTRLSAACAALVTFQMSDRGPLASLISTSALPTEMSQQVVLKSNRVSHRFASMISDGISEGSIRPIDAAVASQMLTATLTSVADLRAWFPDVTGEQAIDLYLKPLLLGITTS